MDKKQYADDLELDEFCHMLLQSVTEMKADKVARKTIVTLPKIEDVRKKTGLTQRNFATLLGVSPRTLQAWEQGKRNPSGAARTLLVLADRNPTIFADLLQHPTAQ